MGCCQLTKVCDDNIADELHLIHGVCPKSVETDHSTGDPSVVRYADPASVAVGIMVGVVTTTSTDNDREGSSLEGVDQ